MTVSESIIDARGVTKRFGSFEALSAFDLAVHPGECVGLLGPNGAGKTTFIGCLYGVVERSGGVLRVFGLDPRHAARAIKERIGVVPQENALDEGLTVRENLQIYARFAGLAGMNVHHQIDQLLAHMSLDHKANATIKTLSGGMKRRLAFVRALLAEPELLILDEPTTGLDPSVRHLLWERVIQLRNAGKTILVTTHYMHEAEILCDRVIILHRGKVAGQGAPREMIAGHTPGYVALFEPEARESLADHLGNGWDLYEQGDQCCVRAPRLEDLLTLQKTSNRVALQLRPANLEDVYLKLTGRELEDND